MSRSVRLALAAPLLFALAVPVLAQPKKEAPRNYGLGHAASADQIAGWDIDVRPDGQGAPAGRGSVKDGEKVYMDKCAACHGEFGESAGRWPQIAQGKGTLASHDPVKTVGSYFPYLSTVLDYIRRSMPFGDAESLTNDELYAVTAYVLYLNDVIKDEGFELNERNFAAIRLPNEPNFLDDDRESSEREFWKPEPCMASCLPGEARIVGRARAVDVTPETGKGGPKVE